MRRATIICFALLVLSNFPAASQDRPLTFTSEVSEGQSFRKDIGHGLDFVLVPNSMGDGISGWTIGVSPREKQSNPECTDYVWVVTPPYHFQNVRYLDTSYGTSAQDAVRESPREFSFVMNCRDYEVERKRVELAIYHSGASQQEVDEAMGKLGSSPQGKGKLWIVDSKITPGKETADNSDLGVIHWIMCRIEIKFPPETEPSPKH